MPLPHLAVCLSGAILGICHTPQTPFRPWAPVQGGVCWIVNERGGFAPLDWEVENLQTCAARLEVVYLQRGRTVVGAFQGVYVYIDATMIAQAGRYGRPSQLIGPADRRKIDEDIRLLLEARAREKSGR